MFDESRLQHLTTDFFDQQLEPEEKLELEAMLTASSRARQYFLSQAEWHGLTREWALRECTLGLTTPLESNVTEATLPRRSRRSFWIASGLAACLILSLSILHFRGTETLPRSVATLNESTVRYDVAMLAQSAGVVWEPGQKTFAIGSALPKGWLRIREGTVRLDFYSGARVFLQGPASLELISADLTRLERGILSASVPPPAQGFTVLNGDFKVVDRGTEFGMRAENPGECDIHVFDGQVDLQGNFPASVSRELFQGDALAIRPGKATPFSADRRTFTDPAALNHVEVLQTKAEWEAWTRSSQTFRTTERLLVYYDFENLNSPVSVVPNRASRNPEDSFATVIGCEKLSGRWEEKGSLGFTKTSDRVRFRITGTTPSLTMMAWVRVDSLQLDHNSLLSMSADEVGEVHWKLDKSGRLLLGIRASSVLDYNSWERLESPRVVTERDFGRWMHFATVIDGENHLMKHFVNGEEVSSGPIKRPTPIRLGFANLGNFDPATPERAKFGTGRSFNGRIDEFALVGRSMSADEIRKAAR